MRELVRLLWDNIKTRLREARTPPMEYLPSCIGYQEPGLRYRERLQRVRTGNRKGDK